MKRLFAILLSICSIVSCNKELEICSSTTTIEVGLNAAASKTVLDGTKVYWSNGDRIRANGVESEPLIEVAPKTSCASFTLPQSVSCPVSILYPSSFWKDSGTISLPVVQKWSDGSFSTSTCPAAGVLQSSDGTVSLKSICSLVKLPLSSSHKHPIKAVLFSGGGGEQVCGEFLLDYSSGSTTPAGGFSQIKLVADSLELGETPIDLYFVVPPGNYAGLSFRIVDTENHYMDISKKSAASLSSGTLYSFPVVDFKPTGTLIDADQNDFKPDSAKVDGPLRILFIGNSFTDDAVKHLPGLICAAGLSNKVKMAHMYYGGRIMQEYDDWTKSDYTVNVFEPGATAWTDKGSNFSIYDVASSGQWDIITLQEHTGNYHAWVWDNTEKSYFDGMFEKLNATQKEKPEYWYIFSQAYYDMNRIGTGSRSYMTWPLENTRSAQLTMYSVIADFAGKVMDNCPFDGILPTGTMLQNLRTSDLDNVMDLTRDGYHMDYGITRYGAACLLFESLITPKFGITLDENSYRFSQSSTTSGSYSTPVTDANAPVALAAARYAMSAPYEITDMSTPPAPVELEGSGTSADPYKIVKAADMKKISGALRKDSLIFFKLTADVDMAAITDWEPLCTTDNNRHIDFNGDGHTISNFSCSTSSMSSFFGILNGNVHNLNFEKCTVSSANASGLLAAISGTSSTVFITGVHAKNCSVSTSSTGSVNAGGLVASIGNGTVVNCSFQGTVSTMNKSGYGAYVGGLAGQVTSASSFERCWVDVVMKGTSYNYCAGGLIGGSGQNIAATVKNCCSFGSMSGMCFFGGIVGELSTGSSVINCYSTMSISSTYAVGGIVGRACNYCNPNTSKTFDTDINITIKNCIAWNPSITSTKKTSPSSGYSSGAVVAFNVYKNTLSSCYRKSDMVFDMYPTDSYNILVDQEDSGPLSPYVKLGTETYYTPYHGKASKAGDTVSSIAVSLGWDSAVWNFSSSYPTLL